MRDLIGRTLGHYRIAEKIGEGGMGEVYRAHDERLDRDVAIKVLPDQVAGDTDRLRRFEREAKAVAALSHPNILEIHAFDTEGNVTFAATEFLEGETLRELLQKERGPLSWEQIQEIGAATASGLAAAHDKGVVHRDIKPSNIFLCTDGRVKILDFGLAATHEAVDGEAETASIKAPITREGAVMGTVSYMSPEQAEGKPVDHRSDIFSLGIVLYEMATGKRPFSGDSTASTLSAILRDTPPSVTEINPALPPFYSKIVRRCLVKDPERRYQHAKDLRNELEELKQEVDSGEAMDRAVPPPAPTKWKWIALVTGAAAAVVVSYLLLTARDTASPITGEITRLTTQSGYEFFPSLSPDGEFVVYAGEGSGNWDIYLLRVGGENAVNLTEDSPETDWQPAFSPDGQQIAFRSERQGGGIFIMGATGESVRRLTDNGFNPSWSSDGEEIVYATEQVFVNPDSRNISPSQLWALDVSTGEERLITKGDAVQPSWSPHGHRIAYWGVPLAQRESAAPEPQGQAWQGRRAIWTIAAAGGVPRLVIGDGSLVWNPVWSHDGEHLYFSSNRGGTLNLWRVPIDEVSGKTLGEPEAATTPSTWVGHMSISRNGRRIAYASLGSDSNLYRIAFDPVTGSVVGQAEPVLKDSRRPFFPEVSPDGRLLVVHMDEKWEDNAVIGTDGTGFRNLTDDPHLDRRPHWSPDGKQITFFSNRSGEFQLWSIRPDGSDLRQLTGGRGQVITSIWSPDGSQILSVMRPSGDAEGTAVLWNPTEPWHGQKLKELPPLISSDGAERYVFGNHADWSPDGTRIVSRMTGGDIVIFDLRTWRYEVVTNFDSTSGEGARWVRWLSDGRRVLFNDRQRTLKLLDVGTKAQSEVLSLKPERIGKFCISKSNDLIYLVATTGEGDIWMLSFDEKR